MPAATHADNADSPTMHAPTPLALVAHPSAPQTAVASLAVGCRRSGTGGLAIDYRLRGDLAQLALVHPPAALPPERLWEYSCFEAFVAVAGCDAYREFNFSPNGQWASFAFAAYRERRREALPTGVQPAIACAFDAGELRLWVEVPAALLPAVGARPGAQAVELAIGLAAVIVGGDGATSWWALAHPAAKPDFHQRAAFVLRLPAATGGKGE